MDQVAGKPAELRALAVRIAKYRRGRPARSRLPPELWKEATLWTRKLGAYQASRALGVSYESLRRRADAAAEPGRAEFVEFSGAQVLGAAAGHVVEMADAGGRRLTIRVGSGPALDVAAVVAAFRGVGP